MRLLIILFVVNVSCLSAQEVGDFDYVFTSLEEAKETPNMVYRLSLEKQRLDEIPEVIYTFKNLRYLNLRKNKISQLTASIGELVLLEELNLSNNRINIIPPQIGKLQELEELVLAKNKIEKLPKELGNLQKLKKLNLWLNDIKEVDEDILELKQLIVFDLRGMPIKNEIKKALIKNLPKTKILLTEGCECSF